MKNKNKITLKTAKKNANNQKAPATSYMSLIFLKQIYKIDNSILRVASLPKGNARITIFNLLGKEVMNASFTTNGLKHISIPKLARGTYTLRIKPTSNQLNREIILE